MPAYSRVVKVPGKSASELYDLVSREIDRLLPDSPVKISEIRREPAQKRVSAKSTVGQAIVQCAEGELKIEGKLSIFAAPFRSKIDEGIDAWLQQTLGIQPS